MGLEHPGAWATINYLDDVIVSFVFLFVMLLWIQTQRFLPFRGVVILFQLGVFLFLNIVIMEHGFFLVTGSQGSWGVLKYLILNIKDVLVAGKSGEVKHLYWMYSLPLIGTVGAYLLAGWMEKRWEQKSGGTNIASKAIVALCVLAVLTTFFFRRARPFQPSNPYYYLEVNPIAKIGTEGFQDLFESTLHASSEKSGKVPFASRKLMWTQGPSTKPKNLLVLVLESFRPSASTVYRPHLKTTPFLAKMAKNSMVIESMYTTVPHTSKALVSSLCGIYPKISMPIASSKPGQLPGQCLAALLAQNNYQTRHIQTPPLYFEGRKTLALNMGFQHVLGKSSFEKQKKFAPIGYFGYEDKVLVNPALQWIDRVIAKKKRFYLNILTIISHHDYRLPPNVRPQTYAVRPTKELFIPNQPKELKFYNRYLQTIKYQDEMVQSLYEGLKQRKLLDDTLILIFGDHGEGFGEHKRHQHDNVIWDEGLRVFAMIHNPKLFPKPMWVKGNRQVQDFMPTIQRLMGFQQSGGSLVGRSLFTPPDPKRKLFHSCWYENQCMAMRQGPLKFISHYHNRPPEIFNVANDPFEQKNLFSSSAKLRDQFWKAAQQMKKWKESVNLVHDLHRIESEKTR